MRVISMLHTRFLVALLYPFAGRALLIGLLLVGERVQNGRIKPHAQPRHDRIPEGE